MVAQQVVGGDEPLFKKTGSLVGRHGHTSLQKGMKTFRNCREKPHITDEQPEAVGDHYGTDLVNDTVFPGSIDDQGGEKQVKDHQQSYVHAVKVVWFPVVKIKENILPQDLPHKSHRKIGHHKKPHKALHTRYPAYYPGGIIIAVADRKEGDSTVIKGHCSHRELVRVAQG